MEGDPSRFLTEAPEDSFVERPADEELELIPNVLRRLVTDFAAIGTVHASGQVRETFDDDIETQFNFSGSINSRGAFSIDRTELYEGTEFTRPISYDGSNLRRGLPQAPYFEVVPGDNQTRDLTLAAEFPAHATLSMWLQNPFWVFPRRTEDYEQSATMTPTDFLSPHQEVQLVRAIDENGTTSAKLYIAATESDVTPLAYEALNAFGQVSLRVQFDNFAFVGPGIRRPTTVCVERFSNAGREWSMLINLTNIAISTTPQDIDQLASPHKAWIVRWNHDKPAPFLVSRRLGGGAHFDAQIPEQMDCVAWRVRPKGMQLLDQGILIPGTYDSESMQASFNLPAEFANWDVNIQAVGLSSTVSAEALKSNIVHLGSPN